MQLYLPDKMRGNCHYLKMHYFCNHHESFCLLYFVVLSFFILNFSPLASASNHTLNVNTSGPQSIDIAKINGTAISSDNITVSTTCRSGYNFSISTSVNNNNLYLGGDSSNNAANTFFSPSDGITPLSNASNTWGYYYNDSTIPTGSSIFSPVPTIGSASLIRTALATPSPTDISDNFNIYYGVSITESIAPGTYKMIQDNNSVNGSIVYYVTMAESCIPYIVVFNPTSIINGNTISGSGTMPNQEIYINVATNLDAESFTAPNGYEFQEWNTAQDGSGTSYSDGASVTNLAISGEIITLYAIWTPTSPYPSNCNPNATTIAQAVCLQDFAGSNRAQIIASMNTETQYTLIDMRDAKPYTIAKYQTGNNQFDVWMTQNLDLDLDEDTTYTNIDTDLGYNTSTGTYNTASWSPSGAAFIDPNDPSWIPDASTFAPTANHAHLWCYNGWYEHPDWGQCWERWFPESYDPGDLYWNGVVSTYLDWDSFYNTCDSSVNGIKNCDNSINPFSTYTSSTGIPQYHLGNYYNWNAAIASNDSRAINDNVVEQSICPAGWTLPRAGYGDDSYYSLLDAYGFSSNVGSGNNAIWTAPLYLALTGFFDGVTSNIGESFGGNTAIPINTNDRRFFHSNSFVNDNTILYTPDTNRGQGNSIRCIARPVSTTWSSTP